MVATHPHADHIGGLIAVLNAFEIEEIWLNGDTSTSKTYAEFTAAIQAEDAVVNIGRRGNKINVGELSFLILNPATLDGTTNNNSIFLSLQYGNVDFLFTGDAEQEAEASMLVSGVVPVPDVEILKVGHHGSRTASSHDFLTATNPEIAIYMAGEGNSYGHPHEETIAVLYEFGAETYGTDMCGTIIVSTDGKSYSIQTERQCAPRAPPIVLPGLAEFTLSNLSISPSKPEVGETTIISFDIANSGGRQGTYTAVLKVNGIKTATKNITLDAGESRSVSFIVTAESSGTYNIEIDGLKDAFEVAERET